MNHKWILFRVFNNTQLTKWYLKSNGKKRHTKLKIVEHFEYCNNLQYKLQNVWRISTVAYNSLVTREKLFMKLISDYVVALKFKIKTLHMLKGIDNLNWSIYLLKFVASTFILHLKVYFFYIYIKFRNNVIFNSESAMSEPSNLFCEYVSTKYADSVLMYLGLSNPN